MFDSDCACHAPELHRDGHPLAFAFLELTPACNNHCPGCSNVYAEQRAVAPLSFAQWRTLLENLRPHVRYVKLTGGEPTLHPDFLPIIAALEELMLPFVVFTNARWSQPEVLLRTWHRAPGLHGLLVSLHGATAPAHEAFSNVPVSFVETLANLQRAIREGIPCTISTVITRHNWHEVDALMELAQTLGAEGVAFNRYIGAPRPELEPAPHQWQAAMRKILHAQQQGVPVKFGVPLTPCMDQSAASPCLAGEAFVTVDPWGRVRPCNHAPVVLGNLWEQTLPDILQGETAQWWRDLVAETCQSCGLLTSCRGGCRAEILLRPAPAYSHSSASPLTVAQSSRAIQSP